MQALVLLLARILICIIFALSGIQKILDFSESAQMLQEKGIKPGWFFLAGCIALLLLGSLFIVLGLWARYGAVLLLIFLIPVSFIMHPPLSHDSMDQIQFLKNLSMMGGLLFIVVHGSGSMSIDSLRSKRQKSH
jgi:putative oxidoreductase